MSGVDAPAVDRPQPLAPLRSLKVKLGLLVALSATVSAVVASAGRWGGVPWWLGVPVTVLLALALTQLLAAGMTAPLRAMTLAAGRMATGAYDVRVEAASRDEVGRLAVAFNTMARDLAAVDRQRRELVANVSHELRTPLAALCALLENLVDGVGPRDPRTLEVALGQAERLSGLVADLLDLARVDAGRAPLRPEPVAVLELLEEAVAQARVLERPVRHTVLVEPPDLEVHADPARLHQLVANLLDNASRHSPPEGEVLVHASRAGDQWLLEVSDQGPGVAAQDRERAFEPFGTLGAADAGGGTGLGLAIARWVSDLHGGVIGFADPDPDGGGEGARVRMRWPVEPPARPPSRATLVPDRSEPPVPTPPTPPPAVPALVEARPVTAPATRPRPLLDDLFGGAWPDDGLAGRPRLLLAVLGVALLAAVVLPLRELGSGTVLVLLACGAVLLAATPRRREPAVLVGAGLAVALTLTAVVRDADWVVVLCLLAGAAVCVTTLTGARGTAAHVLSLVAWPLAALRGLPWVGRTLVAVPGVGRGAALVRTLVFSGLLLVVFVALFVSADALLARWVDAVVPDLTLDTAVLRAFVACAVAGTLLTAVYLALNPPRLEGRDGGATPVAHRFEWIAPVLVVLGVFTAFLAAQAAVVFGGEDYLARTTGLTYAEYVHQGFGQLTVATALTLLVVATAARKAPRGSAADRWWLRGTLGLLCLLTLVVVASALYRMGLYEQAYGLTRLRLLVALFEGWLGLVVLAVIAAGVRWRGAWLPRFAVLSGAAALLVLAAVNPDARIAERNLERYAETGRVDWSYLQGLSDDAAPVLADPPAGLDPREVRCLLGDSRYGGTGTGDWLEWNLGRARAETLRLDAGYGTTSDCAGVSPDLSSGAR